MYRNGETMSDLNAGHNPADPSASVSGATKDALGQALDAILERSLSSSSETQIPSGLCPAPGEWLALALGQESSAETDALMAHAAGCRACAARLRQSLQLMTEDLSSEETEDAANLASASPAWQRKLAIELAKTSRRAARPKTPSRYLWAGAGLAATVLLAAGISLWWQHVHTSERLLAQAYTHSRIFTLRMPGAGFAEITPERHLRGSAGGHESASLLDAHSRIERQLESTPESPHWLQLEARADLLEEKYDQAIDILDRLLAAGPVTSSLLDDDAAAYFQRGTATGSENDRSTALEYLRRANELRPQRYGGAFQRSRGHGGSRPGDECRGDLAPLSEL